MRLQDLPDVEFLDTDTETIKNSIITIAEGILGRKLARADPLRLFLNSLALIIIQQRVAFNHAFKMNLLAYTEGDAMDHIGNFIGCDRIEAAAATTTVQVTLSAVQNHTVIVPAGRQCRILHRKRHRRTHWKPNSDRTGSLPTERNYWQRI